MLFEKVHVQSHSDGDGANLNSKETVSTSLEQHLRNVPLDYIQVGYICILYTKTKLNMPKYRHFLSK